MGDRKYNKGSTMKLRLPKVTIGIAAFNEEKNIHKILTDLSNQIEKGFIIVDILVALDGCTDRTKDEIKKCKDKRVKILEYKTNLGKITRANNILRSAKTEYLVLFDADVKIHDDLACSKLLSPMLKNGSNITLTSGVQLPIVGNTITEKIAYAGALVWEKAKSMSGENSVYHCSGGNRAFARNFYKNLKFPKVMAEDIYPYLYAKQNGFIFEYVPLPIVMYSLPRNIKDYLYRDKRYTLSPLQHKQIFNNAFIDNEFTINNKIRLIALIKALLVNPIYTVLYLALAPAPKIMAYFDKNKFQSTWKVLASTRG